MSEPAITSVSLKGLLTGKPIAVNAVKEPDPPQYKSTETACTKSVSEFDLQKKWSNYAAKIANEKPHIHSILVNRVPLLKNGTEITVELISQSQEIEFIKEKEALVSFLKQELENSNLQLITSVSKKERSETAVAVTPSEKIKAMITKNGALAKLLNGFNLDIE